MPKKAVPVSELKRGMFVCELDRPWLGAPFLLQGFRIESAEHVEALRRFCSHVYVDTERTEIDVAPHLSPAAPPDVITTEAEAAPIAMPGRTNYQDETTIEEEMQAAKAVGNAFVDLLKSVQDDIRKHTVLDVRRVKGALLDMVDSVVRNPSALQLLTTLRQKDPHSVAYSMKVTITLVAFGRHLGCPPDLLEHLGLGGMLLDVGKLRLPAELLAKKAPLSGEEHRLMKRHVDLGIEILNTTPGMPEEVVAMVATHHEREDGSGYPRGLGGDEISLLGKIAAIVDCFEDLTTDRALAPAASPQEALQMLRHGRVRLFEAWLVDRFIQFMGLYPAGSLVELNTGEVAVTLANRSGKPSGPTVMLILDPQKKPYAMRRVISLGDPEGDTAQREVAETLESGTHGIHPCDYLRDAVERLAAAQRALG